MSYIYTEAERTYPLGEDPLGSVLLESVKPIQAGFVDETGHITIEVVISAQARLLGLLAGVHTPHIQMLCSSAFTCTGYVAGGASIHRFCRRQEHAQ